MRLGYCFYEMRSPFLAELCTRALKYTRLLGACVLLTEFKIAGYAKATQRLRNFTELF